MFLYNIHTPSKTFSVQKKDGESFSSLLDRILGKAGLGQSDVSALKKGKEGSGIVYEFEGERWSLEDDDDLAILHERIPTSSAHGATLHLSPPQHHAHFAPSGPPAYSTASSTVKSKSQSKSKPTTESPSKPNGKESSIPIIKTTDYASSHYDPKSAPAKQEKSEDKPANGLSGKAKSVMSTRSRRSKWGNDDAEPLGDLHKRQWLEFHAHNGVRTVTGKVGGIDNVRMLLKSGYKQVYISRPFAIKAGLLPAKFGMGSSGYTGLKTLGNVSITVGSKTAQHTALVNEEEHFDVVLGRQWLERMNVKIDTLDPTSLTYMDNGEAIPCDLVVLKDAEGNVITVT